MINLVLSFSLLSIALQSSLGPSIGMESMVEFNVAFDEAKKNDMNSKTFIDMLKDERSKERINQDLIIEACANGAVNAVEYLLDQDIALDRNLWDFLSLNKNFNDDGLYKVCELCLTHPKTKDIPDYGFFYRLSHLFHERFFNLFVERGRYKPKHSDLSSFARNDNLAAMKHLIEDFGLDPSRQGNALLSDAITLGNKPIIKYLLKDPRVQFVAKIGIPDSLLREQLYFYPERCQSWWRYKHGLIRKLLKLVNMKETRRENRESIWMYLRNNVKPFTRLVDFDRALLNGDIKLREAEIRYDQIYRLLKRYQCYFIMVIIKEKTEMLPVYAAIANASGNQRCGDICHFKFI